MAEIKTRVTDQDVTEFLNTVQPESKRQDCFTLRDLFTEITGEEAKMWGTSIIGFGMYHYKSERSTQEGDWPLTGFSPRKQNLTIYIMPGFDDYQDLLETLGKYKTSVSCLYVKRLSDIDTDVLKKLIKAGYISMKKAHNL